MKPEEVVESRLGLVLGSGGARGMAHVGVLRALEERGVRPDLVVGTSIGSVVGAALAAGRLPQVEAVVEKLDMTRAAGAFFEFGVHRDGLIKGRRVMDFLGSFLPDCLIEELPMPYAALATDIATGEPVVIDKGRLFEAIRASISIPGVFTPVRRGRRQLVDGGVSSPVPVRAARLMGAGRVIAVNVDNAKPCPYRTHRLPPVVNKALDLSHHIRSGISEKLGKRLPALDGLLAGRATGFGFFDILLKTIRICEDRIALEEISANPPDVLVSPAVGDIATLDFTRADDAIRAGYEAAAAALPGPPRGPGEAIGRGRRRG